MDHFPINPLHVTALEKRMIDADIIDRLNIFSCRRAPEGDADREPIPDARGTMVGYPYFDEQNKLVNIKYVARKNGEKLLFQSTKHKAKIFYNILAALDPALQEPDGPALAIVEGETDCASVLTAGHPWCLSVPDGGSPAVDKKTGKAIPMKADEELDPGDDRKFEYIVNNWETLEPVRRIILWLDWDDVGYRLRDELARRLGRVRCLLVHRPSWMAEPVVTVTVTDKGTGEKFETKRPVKDANEVLMHFGVEGVQACLRAARPVPMTGLYTLDDFEERPFVTYSTGFKALDPYLQMYDTAFSVVTGLPQSGKSVLWNQIAFNMARIHGWKIALASFEAPIKPQIQGQLRAFFIAKPKDQWEDRDIWLADEFIREHFVFITRDPGGLEDFSASPEWICEKIEDAVIRHGINMAVADPWNQLDHRRKRDEMRDEYVINRIKMIKDTGARVKVATTIIAHPTADAGRNAREGRVLSMYDMADGAAWNNAAEYGMVVHRRGMGRNDVVCEPYLRKVKFQNETGCGPGNCSIVYVPEEGRFDPDLVAAPVNEKVERDDER